MPLLINGSQVDLSHLARILRRMTLDLKGGHKKFDALLEFDFSSHCYSRRPKQNEPIPPGMLVSDGGRINPRDRIFCWDRYHFSLGLVARIDELIDTNGPVQQSRSDNFFCTTVAGLNAAGEHVNISYYVFMRASKDTGPNQEKRISIYVESAYHADPLIPAPVGKGKTISFSKMLGNIWAPG